MNALIIFWYSKIISFTHIIEKTDAGKKPLFLAANEAIRLAAQTAIEEATADGVKEAVS